MRREIYKLLEDFKLLTKNDKLLLTQVEAHEQAVLSILKENIQSQPNRQKTLNRILFLVLQGLIIWQMTNLDYKKICLTFEERYTNIAGNIINFAKNISTTNCNSNSR